MSLLATMTRKCGPLNDSAPSCILRSPCRDVVVKAIQPSTKSSGFVRPSTARRFDSVPTWHAVFEN